MATGTYLVKGLDGAVPYPRLARWAAGAAVPVVLVALAVGRGLSWQSVAVGSITYLIGCLGVGWLLWRQGHQPVPATTWEGLVRTAEHADATAVEYRNERDAARAQVRKLLADRVNGVSTETATHAASPEMRGADERWRVQAAELQAEVIDSYERTDVLVDELSRLYSLIGRDSTPGRGVDN